MNPALRPILVLALCLGVLPACKRERAASPPETPPHSQAWLEGRLEPQAPGVQPRRGGGLVIRVPSEPVGLCRLHDQMRDAFMTRYTVGPVYETLLELDRETGELRSSLAESWTISEDSRIHLFRLREGVKFHDGTPFDADDVAATLRTVLSPRNATTAMRSYLEGLEKVEVVDARTVMVRWSRASYEGFRTVALAMPILPAEALAEDFNTSAILKRPIGTGPFRFSTWDAGVALVLVRNEDYWREPAWLDQVVIRFVPDATLAGQLFEQGAFDLMTAIPPAQWRAMEAQEWARGYQRIRVLENTFSFLGWNLSRPQLSDARVRRALAMLYPAEEVARSVDLGLEPPTHCPFYRESPACDPALQPWPHAPQRAAELLEEAGWVDGDGDGIREKDGVKLAITLLVTPQSTKAARLAPLLQERWRRAGVALEVEKVDWAVYQQRLRTHDFDAMALLWSAADAENDLHPVFHSSQSEALNYGSYANPAADTLLETLRGEFEPERRTTLGRKLHRILHEDQPYLFLSNRPTLDAAKRRVHGLTPSLAWYELRKVWVEPPPSPPDAG